MLDDDRPRCHALLGVTCELRTAAATPIALSQASTRKAHSRRPPCRLLDAHGGSYQRFRTGERAPSTATCTLASSEVARLATAAVSAALSAGSLRARRQAELERR